MSESTVRTFGGTGIPRVRVRVWTVRKIGIRTREGRQKQISKGGPEGKKAMPRPLEGVLALKNNCRALTAQICRTTTTTTTVRSGP